MLRRKEDMKDWQKDALQGDVIVGKLAPNAIVYDDDTEVPQEAIAEVKPVAEKEIKPVKKATTKKKTAKKVEKMPVEE